MAKDGSQPNISGDEISVFFGVLLLSGYSNTTNYKDYWSNAEDTQNILVKQAISRDRFLILKKYFHLGLDTEMDEKMKATGMNDRFKKVRFLMTHLQKRCGELFIPEQDLSHDESMIK